MRALVVLLLLCACDHRPSKQQKAPPADDKVAQVVVGPDACMQIGVKVAEIIIAATTDPTQKAAYEQERSKLVKRFSDNCTREKWPDATRRCFLAAKSTTDVEACSRELAKLTAPPAGSAAAGSAAAGSAAAGSAKPAANALKRD